MEMTAGCSAHDGHDHLVKLLLIGDSGVGKSSLVSRFTRGKFRPDPKPTSTNNIVARHVCVDGKVFKVQIVDIPGNSSYSDISTEVLSTNGALIVYDVTSLSTFENAEKWYKELQIANGEIEVMLIGNKSDHLVNDFVTTCTDAGKELAERESLVFIETSAKDNKNVEKAFVEVVTLIFEKLIENDTMDAINAHAFPEISSEDRMSRYSGKNEPAHYMLKIESFSLLSEAKTKKFESDIFEAAGYKWRLELYPNGNEERWGNYISIYVTICNAESLPKGREVWVDGKFCVYDHIHHSYITFQVHWKIKLYPKGQGAGKGTNLSIFLQVHNSKLLPDGWTAYAKYNFRACKESRWQCSEHWFYKSSASWGYPSFMLLREVVDPEKGFLLDDVLIVEAEISVVGILKNFN
ncbi:hypothetical protein Lser_V15G46162 [Lactuca serriola]